MNSKFNVCKKILCRKTPKIQKPPRKIVESLARRLSIDLWIMSSFNDDKRHENFVDTRPCVHTYELFVG